MFKSFFINNQLLKTITREIKNFGNHRKQFDKTLTVHRQLKRELKQTKMTNYRPERWWWTAPNQLNDSQPRFKLLSYNILSQDLLIKHMQLYRCHEAEVLRWTYRLQKLKEEILDLNPDILCLQEMQNNHLKSFVRAIRGSRKMEYLYKKRTGAQTDGCAIIYDRNKFKLIDHRCLEYYRSDNEILNRENIALLAKFQIKSDPQKQIIIATTHLLFNPRRTDVRIAQIELLRKELNDFSIVQNGCDNDNLNTNMRLPIIITGDFNSPPFSMELEVLTIPMRTTPGKTSSSASGEPNNASSIRNRSQQNSDDDFLQLIPLNFGDCCSSTYHTDWTLVDFILHTIGSNRMFINIWGIYNLPTIEQCRYIGPIPNRQLGSDHYSLCIVFSVQNRFN